MLNNRLALVAGRRRLYDLAMEKNSFGIPRIFVVLSLALVGLMVLQVLLLHYAWDLKEQAFRRGAQTALAATVVDLESREIEGTAYDYFYAQLDTSDQAGKTVRVEAWAPRVEHYRSPDSWPVRTKLRRLREASSHRGRPDSVVVVVTQDSDRTVLHTRVHDYQPLALRKVVGQWINQAPPPIRDRLDEGQIAAVLRDELAKVGISAVPSFGVVQPPDRNFLEFSRRADGRSTPLQILTGDQSTVIMGSDQVTEAELRASPYRHQLFPLDPFSAPFDLVLVFPQDKLYLFWQIWPLWLASVLFITVIIFSFAKAWRTNVEQRRFGDQLVDFINNMTHEFKTPISTVGLAGEAITRGDVQAEPEVFARYVGMIRDENQRMHRQVEKILQMARFERGDLELKTEPIAVHELLAGVTASFALAFEQRDGRLELDFGAASDQVAGDRVHLESIFSNLIDNAVKYSPEQLQVKVATLCEGDFLLVKISDRGKGIARENQRRVFEKYYRCPTGNRHDVKGYGLGLSFVQSLVAAHGGYVELHSLPGQGTTVNVSLPLAHKEEEHE